jgi:hypothetical protein
MRKKWTPKLRWLPIRRGISDPGNQLVAFSSELLFCVLISVHRYVSSEHILSKTAQLGSWLELVSSFGRNNSVPKHLGTKHFGHVVQNIVKQNFMLLRPWIFLQLLYQRQMQPIKYDFWQVLILGTWLREQETSWYREGMYALVSRWRKAVDVDGGYVEK